MTLPFTISLITFSGTKLYSDPFIMALWYTLATSRTLYIEQETIIIVHRVYLNGDICVKRILRNRNLAAVKEIRYMAYAMMKSTMHLIVFIPCGR